LRTPCPDASVIGHGAVAFVDRNGSLYTQWVGCEIIKLLEEVAVARGFRDQRQREPSAAAVT
jgi:hypothetical protein